MLSPRPQHSPATRPKFVQLCLSAPDWQARIGQGLKNCSKKALQAEPHRAPTLFNYAAYLHKCGRVREGRDMYARACELEPTNSWIQVGGHLFQDAEDVRSTNGVLAATEPQLVQFNDARPICLLYTKHGQCRFGHKCKFKHVHKDLTATNHTERSPSFSTAKPTLLPQPHTPVLPPDLLCLPQRCQPAQSRPYTTTPVKST